MSARPDECAAILPLLEPYLDGELPPAEAGMVRDHLARCPACAAELRLAAVVRDGLRALPQLDAPPAVLAKARAAAGTARVLPLRRPAPARPRLLALAAALSAVLLGATLLFHLLGSARPQHPTPQEVAQATAEARYALAYVGQVSRRAGLELKDEVLPRHLVAPAARTLTRSLEEISASAPRQGS